MNGQTLELVARLWHLHPWSYSNLDWTWPEKPVLGDLALSRGFN